MKKSRREVLQAHYVGLLRKITLRAGLVAMLVSLFAIAPAANAAQITTRSLTLGSSSPAAVTTYAFSMSLPSATHVLSFSAQVCTTALGTCTMPTLFANSSSALTAQPVGFGVASGWTVNTATTGSLRMTVASNASAPAGTSTVSFSNVTNTTTANTSFYVRMTTYSDAAWSVPIDTGTVAASTEDTGDMNVNAQVAESLTFCVGQTGTACSGGGAVSGNSVTLAPNPLTTASIATGTSVMIANTNATSGLVITYLAGQFTNGAHNFTNAFTSGGGASAPGTEEFGLNAAVTGTGGTVTAPYNGSNYAWNPTTPTAIGGSGAGPIANNTWTVTYGANVSNTTPYGSYATTFVYVCTPTF